MRFLLVCSLSLFALCSNTTSAEPVLRIAVASNFKPTLEALIPLWQKQSPAKLLVSSGPSGVLSQQALSGAPFDILLAADTEFPAIVQRRLATAPLFVYTQGSLKLGCHKPFANAETALQDTKRIALANIKTAPYGRAAWQWLAARQSRTNATVIQSGSIANALQTVITGNAECGVLAASFQHLVPELFWYELETSPRLPQAAVIIKPSNTAAEFSRFLLSDEAQGMMQQHGYLTPSAQP